MDTAGVIERVEQAAALDSRAPGLLAAGDRRGAVELATVGLASIREVRSWLAAREANLVRVIGAGDVFPEQTIAEATDTSRHEASSLLDHAGTLDEAPGMADALNDGVITDRYVVVVTRLGRSLTAEQRAEFRSECDGLLGSGQRWTLREFERAAKRIRERILADDGMDRLERQRRATRLTVRTDGDGMVAVRGLFDPLTGAHLAGLLDSTVARLFAEATPATCPDDPIDKQGHLRALAFLRLVTGGGMVAAGVGPVDLEALVDARLAAAAGRRSGRGTDLLVVLDTSQTTGAGEPVVDWGIPVEVPARVLAALVGDANPDVVVVRNGVVLYAAGNLNLGRSTRLANREQRRALRGMYSACAIPGCDVHFNQCHIHHVAWWEDGGFTDLANLLPVCVQHHHRIHTEKWAVTLGPNRQLTVKIRGGPTLTTGPPSRKAA